MDIIANTHPFPALWFMLMLIRGAQIAKCSSVPQTTLPTLTPHQPSIGVAKSDHPTIKV